ncbi:MAG: hypothetical protein EOP37_16590 [Rubrivivax sp.]|nr:MAG: hypothetical protein EOP37_16590 [Rubrivivax sp.]
MPDITNITNINKARDLPNFKQLEAMALEVGRMLSESKEFCETLEAWHRERQERYPGKRPSDSSSEVLARLMKLNDPFYLSRKFTDI